MPPPHFFEDGIQFAPSFTQEACDDAFIPQDQQWDCKLGSEGFGARRLAVPRGAHKQYAVARLKVVGTEQLNSVLLLDHCGQFVENNLRQIRSCSRSFGSTSNTPLALAD